MVTNPFTNNKLSVCVGPTKTEIQTKETKYITQKTTGHRYITHCFSCILNRRRTHKMYRGSDGRITVAHLCTKLYIFFLAFSRFMALPLLCESSKFCIRPVRASAKSKYSSQVIESFPSCTVCTVSTRFAAERTRFTISQLL